VPLHLGHLDPDALKVQLARSTLPDIEIGSMRLSFDFQMNGRAAPFHPVISILLPPHPDHIACFSLRDSTHVSRGALAAPSPSRVLSVNDNSRTSCATGRESRAKQGVFTPQLGDQDHTSANFYRRGKRGVRLMGQHQTLCVKFAIFLLTFPHNNTVQSQYLCF